MHLAVRDFRIDRLRDLIKRGCDVEAQTDRTEIAMHVAAFMNGLLDILIILVKNGKANLEAREFRAGTSLHKSCAWRQGRQFKVSTTTGRRSACKRYLQCRRIL